MRQISGLFEAKIRANICKTTDLLSFASKARSRIPLGLVTILVFYIEQQEFLTTAIYLPHYYHILKIIALNLKLYIGCVKIEFLFFYSWLYHVTYRL